MPSIKAYDVVYLDNEGLEAPLELVWFYYSWEEAQKHADEENARMTRHWVTILRERELNEKH